MAKELSRKDMDQLQKWIGTGSKTFSLLYSITRDGCSSTIFHQKCDNQGPTVTVLFNPSGTVYGGYTSLAWTSRGAYAVDGSAFLFRLQNDGKPAPVKFSRTGEGNDIYDNQNYGPTFGGGHDTFGGGHDLRTFTSQCKANEGIFTLNGSLMLGKSYKNSISNDEVNNGSMDVRELKVYNVEDGYHVMENPWRKTPEWNEKYMEELKENIVTFEPRSDMQLKEIRLLMVGQVGAGKSSFYNTVDSIFRGQISMKACSGCDEHSVTAKYSPYTVQDRSGRTLNFRLCDTPGFEENMGLDVVECSHLLDGHVPDNFLFNPTSPITFETPGFIKEPTMADKIHCVLFVIDACTLDDMNEKLKEKFRRFKTLMNQRGIPYVLLLTKIDKLCEELEDDLSNVFKYAKVEKVVDEASNLFGIGRNKIFPIKNYEKEMEVEESVNILSLIALGKVLNYTQDRLPDINTSKLESNSETDVYGLS